MGTPNTAQCPLCGEENRCAMALPETERPAECWCVAKQFPPALLAEAPASACICANCLESAAKPAAKDD